MASIEEMQKLGYTAAKPKQGTAEQVVQFLSGMNEAAQKKQDKEKQDTMDQVKLYGDLRNAGYSQEEAHARVTRSYRSTDFVQKLLTGQKDDAFQRPAGEDAAGTDRRKANADIAKTEAETKKSTAQAEYYKAGGPGRKSYDGLTPNQIQTRIKSLQDQIGIGEPDEDAQINEEISYLNDLFNKKSGFKKDGSAEDVSQVPAGSPTDETQKMMAENAKVVMTGPDGKQYRVPKANVAKAKLRGFR